MVMTTTIDGGWIIQTPVEKDNKDIFYKALKMLIRISYEPLEVGIKRYLGKTQYLFIAKSVAVMYPNQTGLVRIYIMAVLHHIEYKVINIEKIM